MQKKKKTLKKTTKPKTTSTNDLDLDRKKQLQYTTKQHFATEAILPVDTFYVFYSVFCYI